ncbi:MAG: nitrous oxide reductase accessory protein NosL [Proteobacteria bacterium]|nr:nitrous oxide reductase accessory protein NosL [Pseudomonadota bacterium]
MGALAVSAPWSLPAMRRALAPQAAPEPDVCIVAPPTRYDPASGLAPTAARNVPADARCPVCGMFPARAPQWAAQVIFDNGDAQFFDSPLSLFMYLQDVARYSPGRSAAQIVAHYVTDASDPGPSRWIDALGAYYVHGSSARGPMRAGNLPAFAERAAAQSFAAQRGGTVLAFGAIDAALIAQLAGSAGHGHH